MRENEFLRRSDRSYLCLVAIYVIHALLLNVFVKPQIDVRINSVTLSSSYFRTMSEQSSNANKSSSDTVTTGYHYVSQEDLSLTSEFNSTKFPDRSKHGNDDYSVDSSTDVFLQQSQSDGAAIRFLAASKASGVSRIMNDVMNIAGTIIKNLSPAALGILSGCLVFLLTFTENDYV